MRCSGAITTSQGLCPVWGMKAHIEDSQDAGWSNPSDAGDAFTSTRRRNRNGKRPFYGYFPVSGRGKPDYYRILLNQGKSREEALEILEPDPG